MACVEPAIQLESSSNRSLNDDESNGVGRQIFFNAEQRMRRNLRFFFMNPIEKFQAKGRLPWKLGVQIFKIALVTVQLVLFGYDSYTFQQTQRDTNIALNHLFLRGWSSIREVAAYPPSSGPYAVYTKSDFYSHLDGVIRRFTNVTETSIASLGYDTLDGSLGNFTICKKQYEKGHLYPHNETLHFDSTKSTECLQLEKLFPKNDRNWQNFSSKDYLERKKIRLSFQRLIDVTMHFTLKTVYLKSLSTLDLPECYKNEVEIKYNNEAHDGQLLVTLKCSNRKLVCHTNVHYEETGKWELFFRESVNVLVIVTCACSFVLCSRSLLRAQTLRKRTESFFWAKNRTKLTFLDKIEFVDFWYVMILTNDILIVLGSLIKMQLEQRIIDGAQYNFCSTLLGSGNLLVWAGVLRYLGFFRKYNILILTMKRATPNILRFLLCAILLYMGFCFCGWVVLGPHNIKFRSLSSTSECLFALMNGDDMFATFAIMGESTGMIWWFARIYLYTFLILFIYCVISLFLSVIMDSYETIRESYEKKSKSSDLWQFVEETNCEEDQSYQHIRMHGDDSCRRSFRENWDGMWKRLFPPRAELQFDE